MNFISRIRKTYVLHISIFVILKIQAGLLLLVSKFVYYSYFKKNVFQRGMQAAKFAIDRLHCSTNPHVLFT